MSSAPYLCPAHLVTQPLGVSWKSLGVQGSTNPPEAANTAALVAVVQTASNQVDVETGMTPRSMIVAEAIRGPSHRLGFLPGNSTARLLTSWHPIPKVLQGAVAPTSQVPKTWTVIPPNGIFPESPPQGFYGTSTAEPYHGGNNAILVPGGNIGGIGWWYGRYGTEVWPTFLNGWPHGSLVAGVSAGVTTLYIDDLTGFVGSAPWINDGSTSEQITVLSAASSVVAAAWSNSVYYPPGAVASLSGVTYQAMLPSGPGSPFGPQSPPASGYWSTTIEPTGPGVLTLAAPGVVNAHSAGATITAIPHAVLWAAALFAKAEALQRGLATVSIPGDSGKAPSTEEAINAAIKEAVANLVPFGRKV